jgi:hypothetical protein
LLEEAGSGASAPASAIAMEGVGGGGGVGGGPGVDTGSIGAIGEEGGVGASIAGVPEGSGGATGAVGVGAADVPVLGGSGDRVGGGALGLLAAASSGAGGPLGGAGAGVLADGGVPSAFGVGGSAGGAVALRVHASVGAVAIADRDLARPANCAHLLHADCMRQFVEQHRGSLCPECKTPFSASLRMGTCPSGVLMVSHSPTSLLGFAGEGTIVMEAHIAPGVQGPQHPNPGRRFTTGGFPRTFYMPVSRADLAFRLQLAFYWRLLFSVGSSLSAATPDSVNWSGRVSVKSELAAGAPRAFSVHAPENVVYFNELDRQLSDLGITAAYADAARRGVRKPYV